MSDYKISGMAADNQVRVFGAYSKDTIEKARVVHNTSPVVTDALGRLITGTALMGAMLKNTKDIITLKIDCQGPIKGMVVTSDSKGNIKGFVNNPQVLLPVNDVHNAIDLGILSVIKDLGLKEPYVGPCQ